MILNAKSFTSTEIVIRQIQSGIGGIEAVPKRPPVESRILRRLLYSSVKRRYSLSNDILLNRGGLGIRDGRTPHDRDRDGILSLAIFLNISALWTPQ